MLDNKPKEGKKYRDGNKLIQVVEVTNSYVIFKSNAILDVLSLTEAMAQWSTIKSNTYWPDSSAIRSVSYLAHPGVLIVTYKNNPNILYTYSVVNEQTWIDLLNSESAGRFIQALPKSLYTSEKIELIEPE
jgi:hypothetical protein